MTIYSVMTLFLMIMTSISDDAIILGVTVNDKSHPLMTSLFVMTFFGK
jgi:hypothetical protein